MKKMTDQELRDLSAILAASQKELYESQKKTDEQIKELRESQEKTDEQMKITDQELRELKESADKVCKSIGNHTNNVGDITEEFFYMGLKEKNKLGNIKYDRIRKNVGETEGKEYDIVMINGDSVAVISVKYKLHNNDIDKFFKEDLQEFKTHFPELKSYHLYGGIASKLITEKQKEKIKDLGLFAISQAGKNVAVLNEKDFKAKVI